MTQYKPGPQDPSLFNIPGGASNCQKSSKCQNTMADLLAASAVRRTPSPPTTHSRPPASWRETTPLFRLLTACPHSPIPPSLAPQAGHHVAHFGVLRDKAVQAWSERLGIATA